MWHSGAMEAWHIGLIVFAVVGLAALLVANRRDRFTARQIKQAMANPPDRPIPGVDNTAQAPTYLTEDKAFLAPHGAASTRLTDQQRTELRAGITDPSAVHVSAGWASPHFITDEPTGWSTVPQPRIIAIDDPLKSEREVLPFLEVAHGAGLVLIAAGFSQHLLDVLAVNAIQRTMKICPVVAHGDVEAIADSLGIIPVSQEDAKAGYLPQESWGEAEWWISSEKESWALHDANHSLAEQKETKSP